ncbi:MAG: GMC family oxidoreductase [Solirubrobacteraceae bacterium]
MPARTEAEIAVVGGGTAGAALAARLAAAGRDVLVIEAGPDYGPRVAGRWPADLLDAGSLPTSHDWGYRTTSAGGGDLVLDRARVLGGCSAHNGCSQNWGWRGDYDAWGQRSPGWSAAELEPAFGRARSALRLRHYAADEIQPFQAAFLEACAAAGHRLADDFDDLDGGAGAGCAPVNIADGMRWNTAFAYLDPVRDRLRILDRTEVERIAPESGGPTRIQVRSPAGPVEIHAAETVLCGGAYGTPELLLRSGIGDPRALARAGTAVRHELAGVGRGLQEHPAIELEFEAGAELAARLADFARGRWLPEEQAILKLASPRCDGPYDLHVYPWIEPDAAAPHTWKCVFPVALVTPRSRGAVEPGGAGGRARIDHRYLSDPSDVAALAHGIAAVLEILAHPPLADLLGSPRTVLPQDDAGALEQFIRGHHAHYWHPGASCPMGPDPGRGAVVDEHARLHGMPSIRVADASIFPAIPRGTTAMPTTVVGERVAELMAAAG